MKLTIINGANLNMLGKREPEIYGNTSFDDYFEELKKRYPEVVFDYYQSNIEGELVDFIQKAGFASDGIIINAGGYAHTSVVIADAIKSVPVKCVEVHISNLYQREEVRHHSLVSAYAKGSIIGLGIEGYRLAIEWFRNQKSDI
ncbi:MAG: type II 3-dehydroquinate dehydratase [Porphyromonadaceae bacterium]|nr:type II 3-dehydroquinate dehydratase [Porphyromonadaceae bacterium]